VASYEKVNEQLQKIIDEQTEPDQQPAVSLLPYLDQ
jgi:hypothetical protein